MREHVESKRKYPAIDAALDLYHLGWNLDDIAEALDDQEDRQAALEWVTEVIITNGHPSYITDHNGGIVAGEVIESRLEGQENAKPVQAQANHQAPAIHERPIGRNTGITRRSGGGTTA